jgi:hypothetical protein
VVCHPCFRELLNSACGIVRRGSVFQMLHDVVFGFVEQICDMNISIVAIFIRIGLKGGNM